MHDLDFWTAMVIFAIVGMVGRIVKTFFNHLTKMAELKNKAAVTKTLNTVQEFQALRAEIQQLRETCTQYDLSLQHLLENVDQRVSHLEARLRPTATSYAPQAADEQQVPLGRSID
jgi:hypothetical protein